MTLTTSAARIPSGYDPADTFYATKSWQGRRVVYSLDLSPTLIVSGLLPRPDADQPTEGNRQVRVSHAQGFAKYVRGNENWVCPALMLRAPDVFTFDLRENVGGVQFGVLSIDKIDRGELRILDGQHRILGFYLAYEQMMRERQKAREVAQAAERNDDPAVVVLLKSQLARIDDQLKRFSSERVSVQIHVTNDPVLYKQMFVDVADNAVGITKSIQAGFDSRKVVHRSLPQVLQHPLLAGRVDAQKDTVSKTSQYWLGTKHVADIVRTLAVGIRGRFGRDKERQFTERGLADFANAFFTGLTVAFDELSEMEGDALSPRDLRQQSLLGSATMIRSLAGSWYDLKDLGYEDAEIIAYFEGLQGIMASPLAPDSPWLDGDLRSSFYLAAGGYTSPNAHRGVDLRLAGALVNWAQERPAWWKQKSDGA